MSAFWRFGSYCSFVQHSATYQGREEFAEFERALIRKRQREDVAVANANRFYNGRQRVVTIEQSEKVRVAGRAKTGALSREPNARRETVHRYLRAAANAKARQTRYDLNS